MNFIRVFQEVGSRLDKEKIRYALIGGFAMALRGVQRQTVDLDFVLMVEDIEKADAIFRDSGYLRVFTSKNVSTYMAQDDELGRIDILHAFRGPTISMLKNSERVKVLEEVKVPVVRLEDIIGLKLQAITNAPDRATRDWSDIRLLIETSATQNKPIDWELISDYCHLFPKSKYGLKEMRSWYGQAD